MIPFEELGARYQGFVREIQTEMPVYIGANVGGGAIGMIHPRVAYKGETASGGKFSPYSTKPMFVTPSSFIVKSGFTSAANKKDAIWRHIDGKPKLLLTGGYAEFRELNNRQSRFKSFEFTSNMWNGTGVVRQWEYNVSVGGRDDESVMKLEENAAREGISLLQLSQSEEKELADMLTIKLKNMFEQWFT